MLRKRIDTCSTLEEVLMKHFGCKKPFLDEVEIFNDGSRNPFTVEGANAYGNLTALLYEIGEITGVSVENIVETLDDIANRNF